MTVSRWIHLGVIVCIVGVPGLIAQDNGSGSTKQDKGGVASIAEEMEIMRRVVVRSLWEQGVGTHGGPFFAAVQTLPSDKANAAAVLKESVAAVSGRRGRHVRYSDRLFNMRGYYVPGRGVFYTLDLRVQVKQVAEAPKTSADPWEEAKQEVRSGRSGSVASRLKRRHPQTRTWSILDPAAIAKAESTLLQTLGKHAAKMKHLPANEGFVIAVYLESSQSSSYRTAGCAWKRHLIIQVPRSALVAFGEGRLGVAELRERATVTRY